MGEIGSALVHNSWDAREYPGEGGNIKSTLRMTLKTKLVPGCDLIVGKY
jgi:hypothetical protein